MRDGSALGTALGFFLIVVTLFPLGLGPDLKLLARLAPGALWIALLLSALLSLPQVFARDFADGSLEAMTAGPVPLEVTVAAKAFVHWLTTGVPLAIGTPVIGLLLNLDVNVVPILLATLLIGTPAISFLGAVGAALTLNARRGGLVVAVLMLPLYIPTLLYGITAIAAVVTPPGDAVAALAMLGAVSLVSLIVGPVGAAAALRYQMH